MYIKLNHPVKNEYVVARFVNFYKLELDCNIDEESSLMYLGCVLPESDTEEIASPFDFISRSGFSAVSKKQLILFPLECFCEIQMVYWDTVLKKIIYLN
jgi:hypothetical protein